MKYILLILIIPNFYLGINAQQKLTLFFCHDLFQSSSLNPAYNNDNLFLYSLPGINTNLGNNAFGYRDLVRSRPGEDTYIVDIDNIIDKLNERNYIQINFKLDIVGFYLDAGEWFFSLTSGEEFNLHFSYDKNFVDFFWNGNAKFIGSNIEFGPVMKGILFKHISLSSGYRYQKLAVGWRFRLLSGLLNSTTRKSYISFQTEDVDYDIFLNYDYQLDLAYEDNFKSRMFSPGFSLDNPGIATDIGVIYEINDRFQFSGSILNLGFINWQSNTSNYKIKGKFGFDGIDINNQMEAGFSNIPTWQDSVKRAFHVEETHVGFSSFLVPQIYLGLNYFTNSNIQLGIIAYSEIFDGIKPGGTFYISKKFKHWLNIGTSYSIKNYTYNNFGFSTILTFPPFQFYMVSDNLPAIILPLYSRNWNMQVGLNLLFR